VIKWLQMKTFFYVSHEKARFLTGSGSDFRKRPDLDPVPDPDLNKFSVKFLLEICSRKFALKSVIMTQKVKIYIP
jgi:hypothetical protein